MRKSLVFIVLAAVCLLPVASGAAKPKPGKLPLVAVFGFLASGGAPVSLEITAAVLDQLAKTRQVETLSFNPELPNIIRAVMEHRLSKDMIDEAWDPKNAVRIAGTLQAQYALCLKGDVADNKVTVTLDLIKTPSGGQWTSTAESGIVAGGGQNRSRSNAISTAASSVVSQIMLEAFGDTEPILSLKPPVETPTPAVETSAPPMTPTPAISTETPASPPAGKAAEAPPQKPIEVRDINAEYSQELKQVDVYVAKNDLRSAAMELRKAVNLAPDKPTARLRLAGIYADLAMNAEAIDECKRALLFDKDNAAIHSLLVKLYLADSASAEAAGECTELIRLDPQNMEARITLGDILWNQAKVDEALHTYQEAAKQDPKNATAHGRLQKLYAARKMYPQALEQILAAKVPSAEAEPDASKRYAALSQVIRDEFVSVQDKLEAARGDFDQGKITREDYYQDCKDSTSRIEALAGYLSTQTAPSDYREAHSHGVLAASLLAQAGGYLVSYLETEKQYYKDQASLLQSEAKTEIDIYAKAFAKS